MDPAHRITKDTSTRKNTMSAGVHSAIETAAVLASREGYTNSLIQGYQDKIAAMESEQQGVVEEAVKKAREEFAGQIGKLKEMVGEQKRALAKASAEIKRLHQQMETMTTTHAGKIKGLQKQLLVGPNSWVEIHVTGKGRKTRTYIRRPFAPLHEALQELAKDVSRPVGMMNFKHGEVKIQGQETKTLQQVCVLVLSFKRVLELTFGDSSTLRTAARLRFCEPACACFGSCGGGRVADMRSRQTKTTFIELE